LVQNIHRIRPVLKDTTEVLIIARFWPSILPEPTQIIDKSADRNWKEIAIKRLEPYVREFCFFNRDIASLARICLNSKRNSAFYFLKEIVGYIRFLFVDHPGNTEGMNHLENVVHTMCESERFMGSNGDYQTAKLFSDIVTVYIKKQLPEDSVSTVIFVILQIWKTEFSTRLLNDSPTIALTRAQWSELETHFREKNPIFESFKIRLPYARNNYVYGVGVKRQVVSFYNELSEIPGFPEVKTDTYEMRESSRKAIEPLPTGYIVVYMPNDESELSYMGHEENISIIPLRKAVNAVGSCIKPNSKRTTIITNDGKRLAKMLIQAGHPHYDIEDVWLNERLIRNGEGMPDRRKPRFLFNNYGLSFDVDSATMVSQLYTVWKSQHEMIEKLQLRNIARLEKEVLWIISGMEVYGIGFDDEAFKWHYGEMIMDKGLREDRLYTDTHASINLEDSQSVEKYISNTSMNEEWKEELRGLYGEYRDIVTETESFAQFYQNVSSGRFHNEINQLGSATGRLSTKLDHTPKKGPLRSYIKAPEGYTFIIADYKNQETRIIYGLSHDTKGIETLERGKDIFIETAALVTGKPESECSHLRDIFKLFVNSVHNGARAYGIQQMLANAHKDVTVEQANEFIEGYFRQHPDVKSWMKKTKEKAREDGYVQTVIGRRQIVFTEQDGTKDSSIYNFPIQGNGADGLKLAMVLLNKKLQGKNARIVLTLHDEIIVESNIDIAGEVRQVVKEVMVEAFTKLVPNVPFDVKMDIRNTWGKLNDPVDPENNV
ncbi:MAG: DNA polymerase A family protein, partial [Deltaproteobacteria bacterium]